MVCIASDSFCLKWSRSWLDLGCHFDPFYLLWQEFANWEGLASPRAHLCPLLHLRLYILQHDNLATQMSRRAKSLGQAIFTNPSQLNQRFQSAFQISQGQDTWKTFPIDRAPLYFFFDPYGQVQSWNNLIHRSISMVPPLFLSFHSCHLRCERGRLSTKQWMGLCLLLRNRGR